MVQWPELRRQGYARRFMSEAVQLSPDAEAATQAPKQPRQRLRIVVVLTTGIMALLGVQLQQRTSADCTCPCQASYRLMRDYPCLMTLLCQYT